MGLAARRERAQTLAPREKFPRSRHHLRTNLRLLRERGTCLKDWTCTYFVHKYAKAGGKARLRGSPSDCHRAPQSLNLKTLGLKNPCLVL
jgi:hypothetical protein